MAEKTAAPQEEAPAAGTRPEAMRSSPSVSLAGMLERLGRWTVALLTRPRVRTAVVGIVLILIGAVWVTSSIWTFPIVIIGVIMIIVAWVGSRLEGRFAVEWSESGAGFEMRARFKAADSHSAGPSLPAPRPSVAHRDTVSTTIPATETVIPDASTVESETIEGEAHTIEVDADEFRALVHAAEALGRDTATTSDTPVTWQENRAA